MLLKQKRTSSRSSHSRSNSDRRTSSSTESSNSRASSSSNSEFQKWPNWKKAITISFSTASTSQFIDSSEKEK